jgi:cobalt-precorrin 5A hydrolase
MIAPHIVSKLSDPAVIVMDERGKNVISLLSGHVGGANELTLKIAAAINANPVITTATDVENKFAVDSFAAKFGLRPEPKDAIKIINSAVLRDETIYLTAGTETAKISSIVADENKFAAMINAAILNNEQIFITADKVKLNLIPQKLIAGIGCKRGISFEKIFSAVSQSCEMINQPLERIKICASVDIKSDEVGLLEFAKNLGAEINFFGVGDLAKKITEYKLSESNFVKDTIGVGNVCEAAALCCVKSARFALTKKSFDGVTVALLFEK